MLTTGGAFTLLNTFSQSDGENPDSPLLQHTNGIFYGTTSSKGGAIGRGTLYSLDAGLGPHVSLVSVSGAVGTSIGILGQGLNTATAVSFNGTTAPFTVSSNTYLEATVPSGATGGYVTVTLPSGTLTSNKQFQVQP